MGRPKVFRLCPKCNESLSGREMLAHKCDAPEPEKPQPEPAKEPDKPDTDEIKLVW